MEENLDNIPRNPQKWAEKAPFLGQWLWVLFWLVIPQALASLLKSDLFTSQSFLYRLGQIMEVAYYVGCGLVLLRLSSAVDRYRTAGICYLIGCAVNAVFAFLPASAIGSGLAVFTSLINVVGGVVLMVAEYQEYMGHSELLEDVDMELSDKWRKLWKWYIGCFIALLGSIVVLFFSPFLGALMGIATTFGLLVIMIVKLVYLYRTAMIFRRWDSGEPPHTETPPTEDPWDRPDQSKS